jgi:hypothetical protein
MKRARIFVFIAAAISLLGVASIAIAGAAFDGAKPATARFHDVDEAIAAGYSFRLPELSGKTCITQPGEGAMGVHMVNLDLVGNPAVDADKPEVLVYEPRNDGTLKLVALEYLVLADAWKGASKPALFGKEFDTTEAGNRYGLPRFYALHAWIWKPNPSGILYAWNPRVDCG